MFEMLAGLLLATAVSGIVPIVNAEILVAAAAAALPLTLLPLVVAVSTAGQMATKTWLFLLARWAPERLPDRGRARLERAGAALARTEGAVGSVVFTSAAVGVPPFYGVSLAAGVLGMRFRTFVLTGSAGRLVRFGALGLLGHRMGPAAIEALTEASAVGFGEAGALVARAADVVRTAWVEHASAIAGLAGV